MIAAVVAAAAGGAIAAVLATRGSDGQTAATVATAATGAAVAQGTETAGQATTGNATVATGGWQRVDAAPLGGAGRQAIQRLAATAGGTVIAVGTQTGSGQRDAATWRITNIGDAPDVAVKRVEAPGTEVAFGIAAIGEDRFVAVGFRQGDPPAGPVDAMAWISDGFAFDAVELRETGYEKMNRVVAADGALVAVGAAGAGVEASGLPQPTDAAVWRSHDSGKTWERVGVATFAHPGYQEMRGVVPFGGGLAAVGLDGKEGAVWLSDGIEWRRVAARAPDVSPNGTRTDVDMRDLAVLDGGLIAVGDITTRAGDRDGAVWTSPDGETWTLVASKAFGGSGDQQVLGVATGAFGAVAVGCSGCDGAHATPVVWTSPDGVTWTRVPASELPPLDGPEQLASVAVAGKLLVAGGTRGEDATLWIEPLPS